MNYVKFRRTPMPSRWALIVLALCIAASMFITYRASAQASKAATPATTAPRPAASKPEDSATLPDDPTLVPDDKESADNNITFPTDI
jgi:hypothetical protein